MDIATTPLPTVSQDTVRRQVVQVALRLALQAGSWDAVHVHAVAREAGLSLDDVRQHFADKDAIAEGFFDIADEALLRAPRQPGWGQLPIRERLSRAITAWLEALAPYRSLALGMLLYKMHPEHLHLQARGVARISRTVQWIREVAMLPSVGWRRELEEGVLTSIYLATFSCWLTDRTEGAARTRRLLQRLLGRAEQVAVWLGSPR